MAFGRGGSDLFYSSFLNRTKATGRKARLNQAAAGTRVGVAGSRRGADAGVGAAANLRAAEDASPRAKAAGGSEAASC